MKKITNTEPESQQIPRSRNKESYIKVHHNQIALLKTDDKKKLLKAAGKKETYIYIERKENEERILIRNDASKQSNTFKFLKEKKLSPRIFIPTENICQKQKRNKNIFRYTKDERMCPY